MLQNLRINTYQLQEFHGIPNDAIIGFSKINLFRQMKNMDDRHCSEMLKMAFVLYFSYEHLLKDGIVDLEETPKVI